MSYKLFKHQEIALEKAERHDGYGLFMETGTGKTPVAIRLILDRWAFSGVKTLVVCPLSVIEGVWIPELAKFAPELRVVNLWKALRKKKPLPDADVYVINYESVYRLPFSLDRFQFLVADESSKFKNPKAKVTKFLLKQSQKTKYRLVMSGTPAPNTPLEYWSQMYFINPEILGQNFYVYRAVNFFNYGYGHYLWKPRRKFLENLPKRLSAQSYSIRKAECTDLPEQIFELRKCQMKPEQRGIYGKLLLRNIAEFKNHTVLGQNELAKIMKLRQITSGFMIDDAKKVVELSDTKITVLKDVLDEIGKEQVIIWCQFHWEIEKLKSLLGDRAGVLYGGASGKEKEEAIKSFQRNGTQYLIAHPRTGGYGLNLTNCSYVVYYSLSYSLEEEKQSQDRCHRIGQKRNVTYIYLLAENSIDEKIYRALRSKEKVSTAVLNMIKDEA